MRAVISEPEANAASTTRVPCDRPEMMRLRLGKLAASRRAERVSADQQANAMGQRQMFAGVDAVQTCAHDRNGGCLRHAVARRHIGQGPFGRLRLRPVPDPTRWSTAARSAWQPGTYVCPLGRGLRLPTTARHCPSQKGVPCTRAGAPITYSIRGGSSVSSIFWESAGFPG